MKSGMKRWAMSGACCRYHGDVLEHVPHTRGVHVPRPADLGRDELAAHQGPIVVGEAGEVAGYEGSAEDGEPDEPDRALDSQPEAASTVYMNTTTTDVAELSG